MEPLLLDLFCGQGGAAMGYHRAGFRVIGVDSKPQPYYPYEFHQLDWEKGLQYFGKRVEAIHASPPCKAHTKLQALVNTDWPNLLTPVLKALEAQDRPWVVENVPGAPMEPDTVLCGSMFDLDVRRHRWFRQSFTVYQPECHHDLQGKVYMVHGHPGGITARGEQKGSTADWRKAMDMPWATAAGLSQAIPPAYTEYIGWHLRKHLGWAC